MPRERIMSFDSATAHHARERFDTFCTFSGMQYKHAPGDPQ